MQPKDNETIVTLIQKLKVDYLLATKRMPTRLILNPDSVRELLFWISEDPDEQEQYREPPATCEPIYRGMFIRVDLHARVPRVYFQES